MVKKSANNPVDPSKVLDADVAKPQSSGAKVIVACKIGIGYFDLQHNEPRTISENTQTGPREVTVYYPVGKMVRIRGTAYPRGTPPVGFPSAPEMIGGYALTRNVDKDFWDRWEHQHARDPYVVNNMIFAAEDFDTVRGKAMEFSGLMSGLEPIAPGNDARIPKPLNPNVTQIEDGKR